MMNVRITQCISAQKSKGLSDENVKPPAASNNSLDLSLNHNNTKLQVQFDGHCLKQHKVTFTHKQVVNIYIVYNINLCSYKQSNDFTLEKSFIWRV